MYSWIQTVIYSSYAILDQLNNSFLVNQMYPIFALGIIELQNWFLETAIILAQLMFGQLDVL